MVFFFFKQKTAYEIKECDWSSDVCSSDLRKVRCFDYLNTEKIAGDIANYLKDIGSSG